MNSFKLKKYTILYTDLELGEDVLCDEEGLGEGLAVHVNADFPVPCSYSSLLDFF